MNNYKIILGDGQILVRQGLKALIEKTDGVEVIGEASDGLELLELLNQVFPDLVILDISNPNLRGLEAIEKIKKRYPHIKILILTIHRDMEFLDRVLSLGADGCLIKENDAGELFHAIEQIRQERIYISSIISQEFTNFLVQRYRSNRSAVSPIESLTTREREILTFAAEGKSSKEIAKLLSISVRTAEKHRYNIMNKLNIKKSIDLAKYAFGKGHASLV